MERESVCMLFAQQYPLEVLSLSLYFLVMLTLALAHARPRPTIPVTTPPPIQLDNGNRLGAISLPYK